jgi:hypothetical protein
MLPGPLPYTGRQEIGNGSQQFPSQRDKCSFFSPRWQTFAREARLQKKERRNRAAVIGSLGHFEERWWLFSDEDHEKNHLSVVDRRLRYRLMK